MMVSINLDPANQQRLDQLAKNRGQDVTDTARQILIDYLDFLALPNDSDDIWAEASVALVPELIDDTPWDTTNDGS